MELFAKPGFHCPAQATSTAHCQWCASTSSLLVKEIPSGTNKLLSISLHSECREGKLLTRCRQGLRFLIMLDPPAHFLNDLCIRHVRFEADHVSSQSGIQLPRDLPDE
jgi:hypothetical protein